MPCDGIDIARCNRLRNTAELQFTRIEPFSGASTHDVAMIPVADANAGNSCCGGLFQEPLCTLRKANGGRR